jgi:hypothetical protein
MARIRSIKPGFGTSEAIAHLSLGCELHFAKLWTYADDEGRGLDNARLIKGAIWPLRDEVDVDQVEDWQGELARAGRIVRYEAIGKRYFQVVNWDEHQKPQHPKASEYPPPPVENAHDGAPSAPESENGLRPAPEPSHEADRKPHEASPKKPPVVVVGEGEGVGEGDVESDTDGADVTRLCDRLADAIEANGSRRPVVGKTWLEACDRMLRLDGRTPEQVERAIDWCQADEFWRANVLSMPKLRDKFDQMRLQAKRATGPPNGRSRSNVDSNFAVLRQLAEHDARAAG